jgi:hypothetical protein
MIVLMTMRNRNFGRYGCRADRPDRRHHVVEQRARYVASPGEQPEHERQVQVDCQQDEHEANGADGDVDGVTEAMGSDIRLWHAQRARGSAVPLFDPAMDRASEAQDDVDHRDQHQRGGQSEDA